MQLKISKTIKVELARTPQERTTGLMYRKSIDEDSGMLFIFDNKRPLSFWGANTYIPLDIAFIKDKEIIDIKKIVPLSTRSVKCNIPCDKVIEVKSDFFNSNGIKIGSIVEIDGEMVTFLSK